MTEELQLRRDRNMLRENPELCCCPLDTCYRRAAGPNREGVGAQVSECALVSELIADLARRRLISTRLAEVLPLLSPN